MATPSFKLRGTHVATPYPLSLTPAETRLVFSLERHFAPANIFPDFYTDRVNRSTNYTHDLTNHTLTTVKHTPGGSELTQIDCLALNERGIFVFESKDYSGYIFGSGHDKVWTETLNFGAEKHTFYNPIRQNATHLAAIRDFLDGALNRPLPLFSIIVFGRDATLKKITNIPPEHTICAQATLHTTLSKIHTQPPLTAAELDTLRQRILAHRVIPTARLRQDHIANISASLNH